MNAHIELGNTVTRTDSYKVSHHLQYPPKTEILFSFFESRGGEFPGVTFFGLQYILKRYLEGVVVTEQTIAKARRRFAAHFGSDTLFNEKGWRRIIDVHGGKLPIRIKAVPEGTTVPTSNVLMTIENTDPELPWLTNYIETILTQVWYPSTVATQSRAMRKLVLSFLEKTGDPSLVDFKVHDFGYRGSTSNESAGIGGAAHLVSFKGTDTMVALDVIEDFYGEECAGFSIPAAEHSTITSWGKEHEVDAYRNMLTSFPSGLVAVVSDSYDIYNACSQLWGKELKEAVINRDGVLVVRPDSGYPPDVVVKVLDILGNAFGYSINSKGYKVLNPKVRVIQGDGIDFSMLRRVLEAMEQHGWSADNVAFGSGGGLLQKVNRDTLRFAFKACAVRIDGLWHDDIMKDPVTDHSKRSKAGRLVLVKDDKTYKTMREEEAMRSGLPNELVTVFENGELLKEYTFAEIRERALIG
ncbi:nicotinate phosphoribosyltransferase [Candidatus Campbellbacteria bacterium]|nr:MAG: nicotinate phosphoribosyltransferase [Candidatus Campbellbacteria bacterium]